MVNGPQAALSNPRAPVETSPATSASTAMPGDVIAVFDGAEVPRDDAALSGEYRLCTIDLIARSENVHKTGFLTRLCNLRYRQKR
jgi:hypothetical protein